MNSVTPVDFFNEPDLENDHANVLTPMKSFYKGKTVFLTGGTGFLGQLYVEKLLRSDVKHIYLLGRAKKGTPAEERLANTFRGIHFLKAYDHDPDYLKRISLIEGDMGKLNIGMSESDQQKLIKNVEIVIHAAADVRFDQKLATLLLTNLRGAREMLELTSRMKKIQAFTFISTAFSHCVRQFIEEKFYECPVDPEVMIKLVELYDANPTETLEILTERIIRPWPNTYTYTKSLTEELVRRYSSKFPICIIRPSIVISTYKDPVPAWCNNVYGLNGMLVAGGLGVLRIIPLKTQIVGTMVCADYVINSTLAALWVTYKDSLKNGMENVKDPKIYQVCTSTDRPTTWGEICGQMTDTFAEYPARQSLWKACPNYVQNPFLFAYFSIIYHAIPAAIIDLALKLKGNKLRVLPIYRKVQYFIVALSYFMTRGFRFDTTNTKRVVARMSPEDQEFYPSDVRLWNWSTYCYDYMNGLKVYIGLESLDELQYAKKKYRRLVILHYLVLFFYYACQIAVFTLLIDKLGLFRNVKNTVTGAIDFLKNPKLVY